MDAVKKNLRRKAVSDKRAGYLYKDLYERFIEEYESCLCRDIQQKLFGHSFDYLWNEESKKIFEEVGDHRDKCPTAVPRVCAWTAEIILNEISHAVKDIL